MIAHDGEELRQTTVAAGDGPAAPVKDRIRQLRRVKAAALKPHPCNWRVHPPEQRAAIEALLAEIGYAGALIARELPDGSLQLIDGHLRAEVSPQADVPVLVVDLDDREAEKLLALHDPIAALARAEQLVLAELSARIDTENAALQELLDSLAAGRGDACAGLCDSAGSPMGAFTPAAGGCFGDGSFGDDKVAHDGEASHHDGASYDSGASHANSASYGSGDSHDSGDSHGNGASYDSGDSHDNGATDDGRPGRNRSRSALDRRSLGVEIPELYQLIVHCRDLREQEELFDRLAAEGYSCRVVNTA